MFSKFKKGRIPGIWHLYWNRLASAALGFQFGSWNKSDNNSTNDHHNNRNNNYKVPPGANLSSPAEIGTLLHTHREAWEPVTNRNTRKSRISYCAGMVPPAANLSSQAEIGTLLHTHREAREPVTIIIIIAITITITPSRPSPHHHPHFQFEVVWFSRTKKVGFRELQFGKQHRKLERWCGKAGVFNFEKPNLKGRL